MEQKKIPALQIIKNYAQFAVIVGILPWSYYYITTLAPYVHHALGLDQLSHLKAGVYIIPIILPPLLLFSLLSRGEK